MKEDGNEASPHPKANLAGFPGLVLGWIAAWSINSQRRGPQALSWPAVLSGALIATMLIAITRDGI